MVVPYTICFCCCYDHVLMLYRFRSPNQDHWNGLGGKLDVQETPLAGIQREVMEEAGIHLDTTAQLSFVGVVSWTNDAERENERRGMYAFVADVPVQVFWRGERVTDEGILCWKPVQWVCDPQNNVVVSNIPHFLPHMLRQRTPCEYRCEYQQGQFIQLIIHPYLAT